MAVGKRKRFEVFKRDGFTCQYCGAKPPVVVLHCDHIDPVSHGGSDEIENLVTSCQGCNLGKSHIPLQQLPPPLNEQIELHKEREEQLAEYRKFLAAKRKRVQKDIAKVAAHFTVLYPQSELTDRFLTVTVKRFLESFTAEELCETFEYAYHKMASKGKHDDPDMTVKYFCGCCWGKLRNQNERNQGNE